MREMIAIIGAGGHTRALTSIIDKYKVIGIFDDSYDPYKKEVVGNILLMGEISDIPKECRLIISSGNSQIRAKYYNQYQEQILCDNLVHNSAIIEKSVDLGKSNQIFANVVVNAFASIGYNNILNTGSIIEHEDVIGNHNHLSIGVTIGGRTRIGSRCFLGAGSVVIDRINICDDVIIGANSLVIRDITEPGTYIGNPVRRIK